MFFDCDFSLGLTQENLEALAGKMDTTKMYGISTKRTSYVQARFRDDTILVNAGLEFGWFQMLTQIDVQFPAGMTPLRLEWSIYGDKGAPPLLPRRLGHQLYAFDFGLFPMYRCDTCHLEFVCTRDPERVVIPTGFPVELLRIILDQAAANRITVTTHFLETARYDTSDNIWRTTR